MWRLLRFFLFLLPAETAHRIGMAWLKAVAFAWRRRRRAPRIHGRQVEALGFRFANPIGLAAGLDKGDVVPEAFFAMGFGFVEIGTVTPKPQEGNPRPRLFRLPEHEALINRMGFNNPGMAVVAARLSKVKQRPGPVWVNIGKNKDTPNDAAVNDYASAVKTLYMAADAFVINVSSPNTPGLRDLQSEERLRPLLRATVETGADFAARRGCAERPVLLKLSPDLSDQELPLIVDVAIEAGISGLIATNTTLARPVEHALAYQEGGFSGPQLMQRSTEVLRQLAARAAGRLTLVGVGGVRTAEDVRMKLDAGATLVELYSSLIYGGPGTVRRLLAGLRRAAR